MTERQKALAFGGDLLTALEFPVDGSREGWLYPLLRAAREATGAAVIYLGETAERGWVRHALVGESLIRREEARLSRAARHVTSRRGAVLESSIHQDGLFRNTSDGWPGIRTASYAAVPVARAAPGRSWLAALRVSGGPPLLPATLEVLEVAARAVAVGLCNEVRWSQLQDLAMTDALTKIPNYRYLRQALHREIALSLRQDQWFTVVMVDVDNLKQYNASHGHLGGSELLCELAGLLRHGIRATDTVAKYGGDEFLLILPGARPAQGLIVCERVRRCLAQRLRGSAGEIITCSFGVAGFPEDGVDFETLVGAADRALFQAKLQGRDAVVCLTAPPEREVA